MCARNDKNHVFFLFFVTDVLKNVLKFQIFFCPENQNFVCPGLIMAHMKLFPAII